MNGGITFNAANGNRRTQAAKAMNQHSAELHLPSPRTSSPTYPDGRSRF
jgi:hypothetical protein